MDPFKVGFTYRQIPWIFAYLHIYNFNGHFNGFLLFSTEALWFGKVLKMIHKKNCLFCITINSTDFKYSLCNKSQTLGYKMIKASNIAEMNNTGVKYPVKRDKHYNQVDQITYLMHSKRYDEAPSKGALC